MDVVPQRANKSHPGSHAILVIGDAMIDYQYWIDHMPKPGEDTIIQSISKNIGGSAANTAIGLAYLGAQTKFYGTIGRDLDGNLMQYEAADNLLTICLQHEIDHVHGVTMIDHLTPSQRVTAMREYHDALEAGARPGDVSVED